MSINWKRAAKLYRARAKQRRIVGEERARYRAALERIAARRCADDGGVTDSSEAIAAYAARVLAQRE